MDSHLSIRAWEPENIPRIVAYFTRMAPADSCRMACETSRFPSPEKYAEILRGEQGAATHAATAFYNIWLVNGEPVGFSSLKEIVFGESGEMHLHMWSELARGKGYGGRLFSLSAVDFYARFRLKRIQCEPSAANPLPNRMLEKAGYHLREKRFGRSSELSAECELNRWDITLDAAKAYLAKNASF